MSTEHVEEDHLYDRCPAQKLSSIVCISGRLGLSHHITAQAMARDAGYMNPILARSLQALQAEHLTEPVSYTHLTLPTKRIV